MDEKKVTKFQKCKAVCRSVWNMIRKIFAWIMRPVVELLSPVFTPVFRFCYFLGASTVLVLKRIGRRVWSYLFGSVKKMKKISKKIRRSLRRAKASVKEKIAEVRQQAENHVAQNKHVEEVEHVRFTAYIRVLLTDKKKRRSTLNCVLPVLALLVFGSVLLFQSSFTYALKVVVRDQFIGYIENESVFEQADKKLQKRIVYNDNEDILYNIPVYSVVRVPADEVLDANEVCDSLIAASGEEFVQATGIYVDDQLIGATTEGTRLKEFLQSLLDEQTTGAPDEVVSFQKNVETVDGLFLSGSVVDYDAIYNKLTGNAIEQVTYTVVAGDTPSGIASSNNMTMAELYALNTDTMSAPDDTLHVGQQLTLQRAQPYLSVQVTRTVTYTEVIPFEKEEIKDSNYYVGTNKVTQTGKNGEAEVTEKKTYVNGIEVASVVVNRDVISEPVAQVTHVGTKIAIYGGGTIDVGNVGATGSYVWPVQGGAYNYVSCEMYGYYGHTGMDIAAPLGTPIVAIDSGVVTVASRLYLNGLYISINHGNGIESLYCHCSQLLVTPGQKVTKGQVIALVGMTGNASGYHLHIEIRKNGVLQNPRLYLGYR